MDTITTPRRQNGTACCSHLQPSSSLKVLPDYLDAPPTRQFWERSVFGLVAMLLFVVGAPQAFTAGAQSFTVTSTTGCVGGRLGLSGTKTPAEVTWSLNGNAVQTLSSSWNPIATVHLSGFAFGLDAGQTTGINGIFVDKNGNVYTTDFSLDKVLKWVPGATEGLIVAGGNGYGADPNQLGSPYDVVVDDSGNVYVAEINNQRVSKWAPGAAQGVTVLGTGVTDNYVVYPRALALDGAGNLYTQDAYNNKVYKLEPGDDSLTLVVEPAGFGSGADQLYGSNSIEVDADGDIYISDYGNNRIQKWAQGAASGITVAGGNDAGPASNQVSQPAYFAIDEQKNVYAYNNYGIYKWAPGATDGVLIVGNNSAGSDLDEVWYNIGMSYVNGALYVANQGVRKFSFETPAFIATSTGTYTAATQNVDGSSGTSNALTIDPYIEMSVTVSHDAIAAGVPVLFTATGINAGPAASYVWAKGGAVVSTSATYTENNPQENDLILVRMTGNSVCGGDTVVTKIVTIHTPMEVSLSGSPCGGNPVSLLANKNLNEVEWSRNDTVIAKDRAMWSSLQLVAGTVYEYGSGLNTFSNQSAIYADDHDTVYVVDNQEHRVVKWAPGATEGVIVAGGNGEGSNANQLDRPTDISVDAYGNLYIVEFWGGRVSKWAPGATEGVTVAGGNGYGSNPDQLYYPNGVFVMPNGDIYVSDMLNNRVQKWPAGATFGITVAGGNGYGSAANQLGNPAGLYVDESGNVYIADQSNHRIQKWAKGAVEGVTVAGGHGYGQAPNQLSYPKNFTLDKSGNIYTANDQQPNIRRWVPGSENSENVIPTADLNNLGYPTALSLTRSGNLFVSMPNQNVVYKLTPVDVYNQKITASGTYKATGTTFYGDVATASASYTAPPVTTITVSAAPGNVIDSGTVVTFTATVQNGGTAPVFEWRKNGALVGSNSPVYSDNNIADEDFVSCSLTGNEPCSYPAHVSSFVTMHFPYTLDINTTASCDSSVLSAAISKPVAALVWKKDDSIIHTFYNEWETNPVTVAGGNGVGTDPNQLGDQGFGIFVEGDGSILVCDGANARVQRWAPGAAYGTTIIGGNGSGTASDQLAYPYQVFKDDGGNIYIGDQGANRVQKWAPGADSGITLIQKLPPDGDYSNFPYPMFVDRSGVIYIGTENAVTRYENGDTVGVIVAGGNGDGGASNQLYYVSDIFVDDSANVYVNDEVNGRIQKWAAGATEGITVAIGSEIGWLGTHSNLMGLSVDHLGNVYVGDNATRSIRRWTPGASEGVELISSPDTGSGPNQFGEYYSFNMDRNENIYVTDFINARIQKFSISDSFPSFTAYPGLYTATATGFSGVSASDTVQIFASTPNTISITASETYVIGRPVTFTASVENPNAGVTYQWQKNGLPVGTNSNIYTDAAQTGHDTVRCQLTTGGTCAPVIISNPIALPALYVDSLKLAGGYPCTDSTISFNAMVSINKIEWKRNDTVIDVTYPYWGNVSSTLIADPAKAYEGICTDLFGNIYLADWAHAEVRKYSFENGTTNVVANIVAAGGNDTGSNANQLKSPAALTVDAAGNLYVMDAGNFRIQKWAPGATEGVTVAGGNGQGDAANQFGLGSYSIKVGADGSIYVADLFNARVQKWTPGATEGITVAGGNGQGAGANQLNFPVSLALDGDTVYVSDFYNSRVQKWAPGATEGVTVAGGNGQGSDANQIAAPFDLFIDGRGDLIVSDAGNGRIQVWKKGVNEGITLIDSLNVGDSPDPFYPAFMALPPNGLGLMTVGVNSGTVRLYADYLQEYKVPSAGNYSAFIKTMSGDTLSLNHVAIIPSVTPQINITSDHGEGLATLVQLGQTITFTAHTENAGDSPVYQWTKNGTNTGTNDSVYTEAGPIDGDLISCAVTSNSICVSNTTVSSNTIGIKMLAGVIVSSDGVCEGSNLTATMSTTQLLQKQWLRNDEEWTRVHYYGDSSLVVAGDGNDGSGLEQVDDPMSTALDQDNNLYIVEKQNHRVTKWLPGATAGIVVAGGNGEGVGADQLSYPNNLAIGNDGSIYVVDNGNNRIQKWAPGAASGTTVAGHSDGSYGYDSTALYVPIAIALDTAQNVYILDGANTRIQKWAPGATYGATVAGGNGNGTAPDQLQFPTNLAIDDSGYIYVAQYYGVKKFTPGNPYGVEMVQDQYGISGLFVNPAGDIYFTTNFHVNLLPKGKEELIKLYDNDEQAGLISVNTTGITIDNNRNLIINDYYNNKVIKVISKASATLEAYDPGTYVFRAKDFEGNVISDTFVVEEHPDLNATVAVASGSATIDGHPVSFEVTLNNSSIPANYQWRKNGVAVSGSGNTYTETNPVAGDFFDCIVTSTNACPVTVTSNPVILNVAPVVALIGDTCEGGVLTMHSNLPMAKVEWIRNGNSYEPEETVYGSWNKEGETIAQVEQLTGENYAYDMYLDKSGNVYVAETDNYRIRKFAPGDANGVTVVQGTPYVDGSEDPYSYFTNVFVDDTGNIYVADNSVSTIKKWAPGATEGVAIAGFGGYGESPTQFGSIQDMQVDSAGNLYVLDMTDDHGARVQKWAAGATEGITIAGGTGNGSADNQIGYSTGMFIDRSGNIYIADKNNSRIQKWAPGATSGVTLAKNTSNNSGPGGPGDGGGASPGDEGSDASAGVTSLSPRDVFVTEDGNLLIADDENNQVVMWQPGAPQGFVVAGVDGYGADASQLSRPYVATIDSGGSLYVLDGNNFRVQKYERHADTVFNHTTQSNNDGAYTVRAITYGGVTTESDAVNVIHVSRPDLYIEATVPIDNLPVGAPVELTATIETTNATEVIQWKKNGMPVGAGIPTYTDNNPAEGDTYNCEVIYSHPCLSVPGITTSNAVMVHLAPIVSISGNPCPGDTMKVTSNVQPSSVTWLVDGTVVHISLPQFDTATTIVAGGNGFGAGANQLSTLGKVLVDNDTIYIADNYNGRVQKWAPGATSGITVAGGNGFGNAPNQVNYPGGMYLDGSRNLYVVDRVFGRVQKFTLGDPNGVTVAGGNGSGFADNKLNGPTDMAADAEGYLYIADVYNNRIQKWYPGESEGSTVAGGHGQGSGANQLSNPSGVFVAKDGTLYVSDEQNHRVQKFENGSTDGVTVAGGHGPGSAANQLWYPAGIWVDNTGTVYVCDAVNGRIQAWTPGATEGVTVMRQLSNPQYLTITPQSNLYVANSGANRVNKYAVTGNMNIVSSTSGLYQAVVADFAGGYSTTDTIRVVPVIEPAISVATEFTFACAGTPILFTATPTDGGTAPTFQWLKNGMPVGTGGDTYTDSSLADNDTIRCTITTTGICPRTAMSNDLVMTVAMPPTINASNLTFSGITDTSIGVKFKRGNGKGVIVLAREASAVTEGPVCATSYVAPSGNVYFDDPSLNTIGQAKIVFKTQTPQSGYLLFDLKGLRAGGQYYFAVYEYDSTAAGIAYSPAITGMKATLNPAPTVAATNIRFQDITGNSFKVKWTNGNGAGRIVIVKALTPVNAAPQDNKNYYANQYHGNGDTVASTGTFSGANYVVYDGPDSSVTVLNVAGDTKYYVSIFEYNKPMGYANYATTSLRGNVTTAPDYVPLARPGVAYTPDLAAFTTAIPAGWNIGLNGALPANDGTNTFPGFYGYNDGVHAYIGSIGGQLFGVKVANKSAVPYTSLLVNYTGTQWYSKGDNSIPDSLFVEYSTNASSLYNPNGNWTRLEKATLSTFNVDTTQAGTGTNWMGEGYYNLIQASITNINLMPGQTMWIRFRDYAKEESNDALAMRNINIVPFSNTYTGTTGAIPTGSYNDLNIANGQYTIASGVTIKKAINIEDGATLHLGGNTLTVNDELYGFGYFGGGSAAALRFNGAGKNYTAYFDPLVNVLHSLSIRKQSNVTLGNELHIAASPKPGYVSVGHATTGNATLFADRYLVLNSDSLGTASINPIYGSLSGDVVVQRWLQTDSSIRLLSHPFTRAIPIGDLHDDVVLNTSGTAAQNIWYYDQALANPASINSLVSDAVWTTYTNLEADWSPTQAIRLLKGKGQALLDFYGEVNQGNMDVAVTSTLTDSFAVIGNPYPASLKLGNALVSATAPGGNMSSAAIWTWDPTKGTAGAFTVIPASKFAATKIPICGAFVAMLTPGTSSSLHFTEHDKVATNVTKAYFRTNGEEDEMDLPAEDEPGITLNKGLQLSISKSGKIYDASYFFFDNDATPAQEHADAPKLNNPEFNFYSLSEGMDKLSVDVRPFEEGKTIELGLNTAEPGKYKFVTEDYNLPMGTELYLVDRQLSKEEILREGSSYTFTVNEDAATKGSRFYLQMGKAVTGLDATLNLDMIPNPASDLVTVHVASSEEATGEIRILTVTGQQLKAVSLKSVMNASAVIPVSDLASGMYMVEFTSGGHKVSKRLIKE